MIKARHRYGVVVRVVLIGALVYYPCVRWPLTLGTVGWPVFHLPEKEKEGMGGGALPGTILENGETLFPGGLVEKDLELAGAPEPEEYSRLPMLLYSSYKVKQGEVIGKIAERMGLNEDTLLSVNNITNARTVQIGQMLKIPNQDGIAYTVGKGDSLSAIAEKFNCSVEALCEVNELFSQVIHPGDSLFIPGAKMDVVMKQEINGDLFLWPVRGSVTSHYGFRISPIDKVTRQFHTRIDIGVPHGTPIKAAMAGRISTVAYNDSYGNYVVVSHHSGYRTLYGHMSRTNAKVGAYVTAGEVIGYAGSTGQSTGPHVHFTVFKNGKTVNPRLLMR